MDTRPLYREAYRDARLDREQMLDDRIELHTRFALPLACILLALAGIPLGITTRRAGKSSAVVLTVVIAFLVLHRPGRRASAAGAAGHIEAGGRGVASGRVFAVLGMVMIARLEIPGDLDVIGAA